MGGDNMHEMSKMRHKRACQGSQWDVRCLSSRVIKLSNLCEG